MQQLRKSRSISLSIWQEIRYRLTHKFEKIEFDVRFVNRHFHRVPSVMAGCSIQRSKYGGHAPHLKAPNDEE